MGAGMNGMDDLETLFRAARTDRPAPSDDLMARVLADAAALQPKAAAPAPRRVAAPAPSRARTGFFAGLAALFGGGGVLAGMGTAAVAGLFLGFAQPAPVSALTAAWGGSAADSSAYDLTSGIDALFAEE